MFMHYVRISSTATMSMRDVTLHHFSISDVITRIRVLVEKVNDVSQFTVFGKSTSLSVKSLQLGAHHRDALTSSGYRLMVPG